VPVIFLTARKEEIDRVAGLELGADDYLTKPFSPRELTARIRAVLRRARNGQTAGPGACPDFQLDSDRKQICYRGQRLDLSRYEYRILKLLLEHPGRVFSRDQLMESVWEDPLASLDRTVDTHMKTLRAKLRQIDPQADCLQTRRGLGYCLKESA
jgi:two-component system catabolic regulation response regulator CreB